eukprot:7808280-Lingulodinium_polyedra.AAC.1
MQQRRSRDRRLRAATAEAADEGERGGMTARVEIEHRVGVCSTVSLVNSASSGGSASASARA